jgi:flagellar biosynthesis GTPase FlhF
MDLTQRKLSKSEWESVEQPVSSSEKEVLNLICKGYHDTTIRYNKYHSLFTFLKIEYSVKMEDYLYNKYFSERISAFAKKYKVANLLDVKVSSKIDLKKADLIRLEQNKVSNLTGEQAYEVILIDHLEQLFINRILKSDKWTHHYYTLFRLIKNNISYLNKYIVQIVNNVLTTYENDISIPLVIANSDKYIEKNTDLLKYSDMTLYEHQKEIFTAVKVRKPKLILYIAPTGTGKTLTPIGLSEQYKVIFVCAARHVGLALARSAISIEKKIAFAFGCSGSEDVRLHYFAAAEVTRDWRSGAIRKVDNTVGHKVEILICDIKSVLLPE